VSDPSATPQDDIGATPQDDIGATPQDDKYLSVARATSLKMCVGHRATSLFTLRSLRSLRYGFFTTFRMTLG